MFPKKGLPSFFWNILYAFAVLFLVATMYNIINIALLSITGETNKVVLGVEPILFGLFYMGIDMGLIEMKRLFGRIVSEAKSKTSKAQGKGR